MTALDPADESIKSPAEKGKSKTLLAAYAKAAEEKELSHFKTMLYDHQKALAEDLEAQEERAAAAAAKKAKKSEKASRKSLGDGDDMDLDDNELGDKPKSKKRKKAEDSDADEKASLAPTLPRVLFCAWIRACRDTSVELHSLT